jgi:FtsP/CotA-like multicopper oxidase with cupredoxin domain
MKRIHVLIKSLKIPVILLVTFLLGASSSSALNLAAVEGQWMPPDSMTPITMWGCIPDTGGCPTGPGPIAWNVGPLQTETPGADLTIVLRNCLSEPVSIVIPGQNPAITTTGTDRITSFAHVEAGVGATATYTWNNLKPGTYLYQSGSNSAKQVHMGLYGALTVGTYATATNEAMIFYSEIDPALHDPPVAATPLTYKPKYFLVNGDAYSSGQTIPFFRHSDPATRNILIRFVNAGLTSHTPVLQGPHMKIIAEDGNPYPYPRVQYSALLAAGKTLDALWHPTETATYALYDRSMSLSTNGSPGGGLMTYLAVDIPPFSWHLFIPATLGNGTR